METPTPAQTPGYTVTLTTPTATSTFVLTPTETPEPECNVISGTTPVPSGWIGNQYYASSGIGADFYKIFDETRGWWDKYRDSDNGLWRILVSMVYKWELDSSGPSLSSDSVYKSASSEAFARKLWDSYNQYGDDGFAFYLGGRDAVRIRVNSLVNAAKTPNGVESYLRSIGMTEELAKGIFYGEGKNIWTNCDWRNGYKDDGPWEFGNPTSASPSLFLKALKAPITSCNGRCIGESEIYYRDTVLTDPPFIAYQEGTIDVHRVIAIVTPRQIANLCNNASCVKQ